MKITYFADTDTLYIEFQPANIVETKDLDDDTLIDIDIHGNVCAITVEHAQQRTNIPNISFEQIVA
ncbi:DUF2283 domain-containing protein [Synechocystis sp. FACHB-383]|nr:DUF2283 domain-containing protein [Synechocystis sp. FACHB-383]